MPCLAGGSLTPPAASSLLPLMAASISGGTRRRPSGRPASHAATDGYNVPLFGNSLASVAATTTYVRVRRGNTASEPAFPSAFPLLTLSGDADQGRKVRVQMLMMQASRPRRVGRCDTGRQDVSDPRRTRPGMAPRSRPGVAHVLSAVPPSESRAAKAAARRAPGGDRGVV